MENKCGKIAAAVGQCLWDTPAVNEPQLYMGETHAKLDTARSTSILALSSVLP